MAERLIKTGVVKTVEGGMALVITTHEPECESCKAKDACSSLGSTGANLEVRARNTAKAAVGDVVKISLSGSSFLKATFLVYMVPMLAVIGGMLCGYLLATIFPGHDEAFVGTLCAIGLFSSFWWLKKKSNQLADRQEFIPEIVSKQTPAKTTPPSNLQCPVQ
jgi:sigma-E factor negative regulatory protein RseC